MPREKPPQMCETEEKTQHSDYATVTSFIRAAQNCQCGKKPAPHLPNHMRVYAAPSASFVPDDKNKPPRLWRFVLHQRRMSLLKRSFNFLNIARIQWCQSRAKFFFQFCKTPSSSSLIALLQSDPTIHIPQTHPRNSGEFTCCDSL